MKNLFSFIIVFLFLIQGIFAQHLISVQEAEKLINSQKALIVSAREKSDYAKVHIKDAINIDISDLETETPVKGKLKSTNEIASILGKNGISKDKKIIVYCNTGVNAGRLYWILKYLGCTDVSIINGQIKAWREARKPLTKAIPKITPTKFTPTINKNIIADKSYVTSKLKTSNTVIVDARSKEDFDAGHIEKAISLPHKLLLSDTKIKSKTELEEIFKKAGITPEKEVILYCKSGSRASFMFFVLTAILNYPNVKVYDGSYNDWTK